MVAPEVFKEYFRQLLNPEQTALNKLYVPKLIIDNFLDRAISLEEIKHMQKIVKLQKAPGEDGIPF